MQTQREKLIEHLEENGWKIIEEDEYSLDWWAAEIWKVESVWSPREFMLWLTFLVDPQGPFEPRQEHVCGIGATHNYPICWQEVQNETFLSFTSDWKTKLPQFIFELSRLRQESAANIEIIS